MRVLWVQLQIGETVLARAVLEAVLEERELHTARLIQIDEQRDDVARAPRCRGQRSTERPSGCIDLASIVRERRVLGRVEVKRLAGGLDGAQRHFGTLLNDSQKHLSTAPKILSILRINRGRHRCDFELEVMASVS